MEQAKVSAPVDVLEGLEAIRLSGRTNMLDVTRVIELALDMDHYATALWVQENSDLYARGIFTGFSAKEQTTTEQPDNTHPSRQVPLDGGLGSSDGKPSVSELFGGICGGGES